jgi:hypothetical protein
VIVLASLCLLLTPEVTPAQFKALIERVEKSEVKIPEALDALSDAAFAPGFDLKAYQRVLGTPDSVRDLKSISVESARRGEIEVVGVKIGGWSHLRARNRAGKDLKLPKSVELIPDFSTSPLFVGQTLALVHTSLQDAGVRYRYHTSFLAPIADGFKMIRTVSGIWTLDDDPDAHLKIDGTTVTLRTIDEPKHFFTTNPERISRSTSRWDLSGATPRLKGTHLQDLEIRAADAWMGTALTARRPTPSQSRFRKSWQMDMRQSGATGRPFLDNWALKSVPGGKELVLDITSRYRFRISAKGVVSFLGATSL